MLFDCCDVSLDMVPVVVVLSVLAPVVVVISGLFACCWSFEPPHATAASTSASPNDFPNVM